MDVPRNPMLQNIVYEDVELTVDNSHFYRCVFNNVAMNFGGGGVPIFQDCSFNNVKLQFSAEAASTIEFLAEMSNIGFARSVGYITNAIRTQTL